MKPAYLQYDSLSDRKEIFYLLEQLHPRRRLEWLNWCCQKSAVPNSSVRPGVSQAMRERLPLALKDDSASEKFSVECYLDSWNLARQYELDMDAAVERLVQMARRSDRRQRDGTR